MAEDAGCRMLARSEDEQWCWLETSKWRAIDWCQVASQLGSPPSLFFFYFFFLVGGIGLGEGSEVGRWVDRGWFRVGCSTKRGWVDGNISNEGFGFLGVQRRAGRLGFG